MMINQDVSAPQAQHDQQHQLAFLLEALLRDAGDGAGRRHRRDRRLHSGDQTDRLRRRSGAAPASRCSARRSDRKSSSKARTELIIFLTPRVIYDTNQIQDATDEIKSNLKRIQKMMRDEKH